MRIVLEYNEDSMDSFDSEILPRVGDTVVIRHLEKQEIAESLGLSAREFNHYVVTGPAYFDIPTDPEEGESWVCLPVRFCTRYYLSKSERGVCTLFKIVDNSAGGFDLVELKSVDYQHISKTV